MNQSNHKCAKGLEATPKNRKTEDKDTKRTKDKGLVTKKTEVTPTPEDSTRDRPTRCTDNGQKTGAGTRQATRQRTDRHTSVGERAKP